MTVAVFVAPCERALTWHRFTRHGRLGDEEVDGVVLRLVVGEVVRGGGRQVLRVVEVIVLAKRVPYVLKERLVVRRQVL